MSHILFCEFRNLHFKIFFSIKRSLNDISELFFENLNKFRISLFFINKTKSHFYFEELRK